MATRGKASVVWELSEEGRVLVDVDAPLRPFGTLPTPSKGIKRDETEPDGEAVLDVAEVPKIPKPN